MRYEIEREDHNHLVDVENERIHEFKDERLGALMREIVGNMGYDVESFRVEVVGKKRGNTGAAVSRSKYINLASLSQLARGCERAVASAPRPKILISINGLCNLLQARLSPAHCLADISHRHNHSICISHKHEQL